MAKNRFRSDLNPFESRTTTEGETPFKIQYLQYEQASEEVSPESSTETSASPFKMELYSVEPTPEFEESAETEFELFASETQEPEFLEMLSDLAAEAEESFAGEVGKSDLEEALAQPDFEDRFERFYDKNYRPLVQRIEGELDRFSSYLSSQLKPDLDPERVEEVIDSFEIVEPEYFFGKIGGFIKKVAKGVKAVARKGLDVAKKVATGPIMAVLQKLKPLVGPLLKRVLKIGLRFIPQQYRTLAQKALSVIEQGRQGEESEIDPAGELQLETYGEMEADPETEVEPLLELEEPFTTETESVEPEIIEVQREFEHNFYSLAQRELGGLSQESMLYESSPEQEVMAADSEITTLNKAREDFIQGIQAGEDVEKLTENFIPAILPALKLGISLIGRDRVVRFIAGYVAKIISPVIGPGLASPLSQAIVDAGLRLIALETPEPVQRERVLAEMITNAVSETVSEVSQLPTSILDGEESVLESFIQDAFSSAVGNNFPTAGLAEEAISTRPLPSGMEWTLRNKGRYKVLSKIFTIRLTPQLAAQIRTFRGGETLQDILQRHQGWDGRTPVDVEVRVFEAVPGTRLGMIAKDYIGITGPRGIRQILPLTRSAATKLLKEPALFSRRFNPRRPLKPGQRLYYVKLVRTSTAIPQIQLKPPAVDLKSNRILVRFVGRSTIEVRAFLNEATARGILAVSKGRVTAEFMKSLQESLLTIGTKALQSLLMRLRIPAFLAKRVAAVAFRWILKNLNEKASDIAGQFVRAVVAPKNGVTMVVSLSLPSDFLSTLRTLTLTSLARIVSSLRALTPNVSVRIIGGYRI